MGDSLTIECIVSTVSGVESSSVMISWMGPGGDTITSDSRVTISGTTGLMSTLNFMYLMEGDEGTYTCNVMILDTIETASIMLNALMGKLFLLTSTHKLLKHFFAQLIFTCKY